MAKQLTKAKLEKIISNPVMPEFAKKDAQSKLDKNDYSDYKPKASTKSSYQKEVERQKKTGDYKEGAGISLLSMSENLKKKPVAKKPSPKKASPKASDDIFKTGSQASKENKDKTKKVTVFDVMTKTGLKNKELVKKYQKVVKEVNDNPDYENWTFAQKKSVVSSVMTMGDASEVLKPSPDSSPKMKVVKEDDKIISDCKKALTDAQYTVTKKTTPSGKKQVKVKRAEKQIIKTKVDSVAATVRKDVNDNKGNKTEILASIKKIQNGLTKILQRLDLMAKNGELEKIKAIEKLLDKLN